MGFVPKELKGAGSPSELKSDKPRDIAPLPILQCCAAIKRLDAGSERILNVSVEKMGFDECVGIAIARSQGINAAVDRSVSNADEPTFLTPPAKLPQVRIAPRY
jgi:hypothetical protein